MTTEPTPPSELTHLPSHVPSPVESGHVELVLAGVFGPQRTVRLDVPGSVADAAAKAGALVIADEEGAPLAALSVENVGTSQPAAGGSSRISGQVTQLRQAPAGPFHRLRRSPHDVHQELAGGPAVAVATARPLLTAEENHLVATATARDARVLVLACLLGSESTGLPPEVLVRALQASMPRLTTPAGQAIIVALPVPAGAGTAAAHGVPEFARAAQIDLLGDGQLDEDTWEHIARTLDAGEAALEQLVAPDVAALLRAWRPPRPRRGLTVLFTGLSGSGKSTVARGVVDTLLERGRAVTVLDGDVARRMLSAGLTFSRADRDLNILRIGWVAGEIARHGGVAVCAPIAPYAATRARARQMVEQHGEFVLVHVSTPLEVCEQRDRKGLYAKARAGLIDNFTGVTDPYEAPDDAEVTIDTSDISVDEAVDRVVGYLEQGGWLG